MPTVMPLSHVFRKPIRGLMNHVVAAIDSFRLPSGPAEIVVLAESHFLPARAPMKNPFLNGKTRRSAARPWNFTSAPPIELSGRKLYSAPIPTTFFTLMKTSPENGRGKPTAAIAPMRSFSLFAGFSGDGVAAG